MSDGTLFFINGPYDQMAAPDNGHDIIELPVKKHGEDVNARYLRTDDTKKWRHGEMVVCTFDGLYVGDIKCNDSKSERSEEMSDVVIDIIGSTEKDGDIEKLKIGSFYRS